MVGGETANELGAVDIATQWFEKELTASEVSVPEFENLCEQVLKQRTLVKSMQANTDAQDEILKKMKAKLMVLMDQFGKSKYSSNSGTLYTKDEFSVKTPKSPEDREKFFAWLKAQDLFDSMITVNSRSLVSLYNSKLEESGDPDFAIPGITEISSYKSLNIRSN
jgi:hypothetical protein